MGKVIFIPYNSGGSGGSVVYDKYDISINVTEVHNTGTCRSLWDESSSFTKDDLEVMFKVHGSNTYNEDLTSSSKTNSSTITSALNTKFLVTHEEFLGPDEIFISVLDVDHFNNDEIGSFSFKFEDAVSTFKTDCVSGNIQINHEKVKDKFNELVSKLSINDEILYKCGSSIVVGEYLGFHQRNDTSHPKHALKVNLKAIDPTKDYCSSEDGYIESIIDLNSTVEVKTLEGFSVEQQVMAPFGHGMEPSKINKIYSSGYAEVEIYSLYKGEIRGILETSIIKIALLRNIK
jgi:hypothetical protein